MDEQPDYFSPFSDDAPLHPVALAGIIIGGFAMLVLPRRYALLPMFIMACFIAQGQRVTVGGLNFNITRIMVLFGWARLLIKGEMKAVKWHTMDTVVIALCMSRTFIYTVLFGEAQAFIYQLGQSFDALGMYFLFRALIRTWEDFDRVVLSFIFVSVPCAMAFFVERATGHNMFFIFGGVSPITQEREGKLRCQGAFPHPIIAGAFWASLLPFVIARWWRGGVSRFWTIIGIWCFMFIIWASWSSTPLGGVICGLIAMCLFPARRHMRALRWGIAITLAVLHFFIMKGPVWSLIAHVDITGGSTGAYRSILIDMAVKNFDTWWLCGVRSIQGPWHTPYFDVPDQYILEGIEGGLLSLTLFVTLIVLGFRAVGKTWRLATNRPNQMVAWGLGAAMLTHVIMYFGVTYFGQSVLAWYLELAVIVSLYECATRQTIRRKRARVMLWRRRVAELAAGEGELPALPSGEAGGASGAEGEVVVEGEVVGEGESEKERPLPRVVADGGL